MMFLAEEVRGTFRLSLFCDCGFCDCGAFVLLAACPAATAAEVTASPERKSLRFMGPHFRVKGNAEGYHLFHIPSEAGAFPKPRAEREFSMATKLFGSASACPEQRTLVRH